jgi:hypothetical protein
MRTRRAFPVPLLAAALLLAAGACGGDPDADPDDELPDGDHAIFDREILHHFDLEVDPQDWAWLQSNARLEEYVPATLVYEGIRIEGAAVRFKGGFGSLHGCFDGDTRICPKLSLKVSFTKFTQGGRFHGLRKLVLNSSVRDPTFLRERLSYDLFRAAGLPSSRTAAATVAVNGAPQGLFVLVEQIDKSYVRDRFEERGGNLYKEVWPQFDWADPYRGALKTNEEIGDVSRMVAFHQAIQDGADVSPFVDVEAMARYLAVDHATDNWDGIRGWYCHLDFPWCFNHNFYWYETPGGRLSLLVWDLDHTFGTANGDLGRSWADPAPSGCQAVPLCELWGIDPCPEAFQPIGLRAPQCDPLLAHVHETARGTTLAALRELVEGPLGAPAVGDLLTRRRAVIRDAVAADPHGPGLPAWEHANGQLDQVLAAQRAAILALLAEEGR